VKFREKHRKTNEKTRYSLKIMKKDDFGARCILFFNEFSPKAPISNSPYLEIDVSPDANSFEIGFLRLSAFQKYVFC